jgi:hypothetical protein
VKTEAGDYFIILGVQFSGSCTTAWTKLRSVSIIAPLCVFTPLRGKHCIYFKADDLNPFYGCGTWDDEGLAEAHDELDGREEDEAEERLLTRLGMSKYYGSEGFDRPPSDVYSYGGGYFGDDGAGVLAP